VNVVMEEAGKKLTVLVVDDDWLIAMSTADMLEDLGHEAIQATTGSRALDMLKNGQRVDLLITDYAMPKMNGVELAEAARQARPHLPILLTTGYGELPSRASDDIPRLSKPYQQNQLARAIAQLLQGSSPER
jgi:CheY-like chemotaxis protein